MRDIFGSEVICDVLLRPFRARVICVYVFDGLCPSLGYGAPSGLWFMFFYGLCPLLKSYSTLRASQLAFGA